ncbi:hypothetical protein AB1Y20_007536 [Prymnesium parvum]|uniref:G-protein coupled receptors family 3 profile domain-containing protein n=1 Tax=Prymnesium parvum TaxID=97485 RepID=A0AB34IVN5_PRYPA|mmetsp:Transcript_22754/g.56575  ORF Transcript_22754/g.56575 Transcript_22754/m.56575 type:complete len:877 (-) Transcript_22754:29-2659(-)
MAVKLLLLLAVVARASADNVTIGFIHRASSGGVFLPFWQRVSCAGLMAVNHANSRDTSIVAEFANLKKTYVSISTDSNSVPKDTIKSYRACKAAGAKGIIGPARSATNTHVGYLGGIDKLVNIGTWTSSPVLSDDVTFPYLARTYYSDSIRAQRVVETLEYFNWTRFAIVHVDDTWANAIVGMVRQQCELPERSPIVMNTFSFDYGVETSVRLAVQRLSQMPTPVYMVLFIAFDIDGEELIDEAYNRGLLTAQHVWIDVEGLSSRPLDTAVNKTTYGTRINGIIRVASTLPEQSFSLYEAAWSKMTVAKCQNALFTAEDNYFTGPAPDIGAFEYDAAASLILALDSLATADESDGDLLKAAVGKLVFQGATGRVQFSPNLDRNLVDAEISLINLVYHPETESVEFRKVRVFTNTWLDVIYIAPIVWATNSSKQPIDLTMIIPDHNQNLIPEVLVALSIGLAGVSIFMAFALIIWTIVFRKRDAVKSSQPFFLILIALGVIISLCACIPLTQDHRNVSPDPTKAAGTPGVYASLDTSCSLTLWLYLIGFDITYSSLFAKLWRVKKIFLNPRIGRAPIRIMNMFMYVIRFLLVDIACLGILQGRTPLFYEVTVVSITAYGEITESRGRCTADSEVWIWLSLIIVLHGVLLMFGNYLVYQLRNVPSEFNEGKYVGFSLANNLQTLVLALMLLLLISETPVISYITKFFAVFWTATVTLLMMFVPKIQQVHFAEDDSDLVEANKLRKAGRKTAKTRQGADGNGGCDSQRNSCDMTGSISLPSGPVVTMQQIYLPIASTEDAQQLAKELIDGLHDGTLPDKWLALLSSKLKSVREDASLEEQADAVAHLLMEGQHLRSLQSKLKKRSNAPRPSSTVVPIAP